MYWRKGCQSTPFEMTALFDELRPQPTVSATVRIRGFGRETLGYCASGLTCGSIMPAEKVSLLETFAPVALSAIGGRLQGSQGGEADGKDHWQEVL